MASAEELRGWVLGALQNYLQQKQRNPGMLSLDLTYVESYVKTQLQTTGEIPDGVNSYGVNLPSDYVDRIREIVWGLVIQGIVVPGASTMQPELPFMQISEWGKRCLAEGEYLPHDAGLYVSRLKSQIGARVPHPFCVFCKKGGRPPTSIAALDAPPETQSLLPAAACLIRPKHCDRFDFDEQLRPAQNRLNACRCGQRIEPLLFEKRRSHALNTL